MSFSHVGVCVRDLGAALRFYTDGLGFERVSDLSVSGEPAATLLRLPDVALDAVYLRRDGVMIELLHYRRPGAVGAGEPRAMNALGLTHLSLRVDDLDATLEALSTCGAQPLPDTRIDDRALRARAAFVTDPDGTLIELVESR